MRHFVDIKDFNKEELNALLDISRHMKFGHDVGRPLDGLHIHDFEKPSTRTRVCLRWVFPSWGEHGILAASDLQRAKAKQSAIQRGSSRYLDGLMIRAMKHGL